MKHVIVVTALDTGDLAREINAKQELGWTTKGSPYYDGREHCQAMEKDIEASKFRPTTDIRGFL
jgi:hypothetical protein